MNIKEFLEGFDGDSMDKLEHVRSNYSEIQTGIIEKATIEAVLSDAKLTAALVKISMQDGHAYQDEVLGVLRSDKFNFIIGSETGDRQIVKLDQMINANIEIAVGGQAVDVSQKLSAIRETLIYLCNKPVNPYKNMTLHSLLIELDEMPYKVVTEIINGYAYINTTSDAEPHNPRLLAFNEQTNQWIRIANFRNVSTEGKYESDLITLRWRTAQLKVDNAYENMI